MKMSEIIAIKRKQGKALFWNSTIAILVVGILLYGCLKTNAPDYITIVCIILLGAGMVIMILGRMDGWDNDEGLLYEHAVDFCHKNNLIIDVDSFHASTRSGMGVKEYWLRMESEEFEDSIRRSHAKPAY